MPKLIKTREADAADVRTVGIPRGLLYYRYHTLWRTFFERLGRTVVVDQPSTRATFAEGDAASVDECCLASKLYMGHVLALLDGRGLDPAGNLRPVDALFIPSTANFGQLKHFCTKFQALPDLVANSLHERHPRILSFAVDELEAHISLREGLMELGARLGERPRDVKAAIHAALHEQQRAEEMLARAQRDLLDSIERLPRAGRPLTILVAAHPYVAHDPFVGGAVEDALRSAGAEVIYADEYDRERAYKKSFEFSATLPWIVNRELVGAILALHDRVDGIVIMSAFPCGPDSMTDDAVQRCVHGKPILALTVDAQSGTAGVETRIESFVDILRYQQKGGYLHD
ncbi:hypothetical protein H6A35_03325 [Collinsella tanakaei]|nr:hypothetical protein [Collinsella tanakaei]